MHTHDYIKAAESLLIEGTAPETVFGGLRNVLEKRRHGGLYPKILRGLIQSLKRREKLDALVVTIARDTDQTLFKREIREAIRALGSTKEPQYHVDPTSIGGYRVESQGKSIDNTYKTQLRALYTSLTKSL